MKQGVHYVKICSECAHFKNEAGVYNPHIQQREPQPECSHPQAASRDLVHGRALCYNERATARGCGKLGKLWEPKKT